MKWYKSPIMVEGKEMWVGFIRKNLGTDKQAFFHNRSKSVLLEYMWNSI